VKLNVRNKKLFIVVNVDWFFLSHRLPVALAAKENGYDVTIVCSETGLSSKIISYGLKFIEVPFSRAGTNISEELLLIRTLLKIYKKGSPDIIHHVTLKPSIYGSVAASWLGIRNVVNAISGLGYNFTAERKGVKQFILKRLLKFSFRSPSLQFIFQNPDDVALFKGSGFVKSNDQIHLIKGSGVDLNEFDYTPEPNEGKIKVLLPARMLYDKGVVEFVKAGEKIKEEFSDTVCFNLAGDIDNHNPAAFSDTELLDLIDPPYINWIGFQKDMASVLKSHHIIVLPSYREGLPKSLIEATAIGRPIITTDAPGCRECVEEGYNGFLVPVRDYIQLSDKIRKLITQEDLRKEMGKNSRTFAEKNFSIIMVVEKTLEIYKGFTI
jgi:glycosyltransferase involved in cell wall biosynthesis